jgi:hypothetical protein
MEIDIILLYIYYIVYIYYNKVLGKIIKNEKIFFLKNILKHFSIGNHGVFSNFHILILFPHDALVP